MKNNKFKVSVCITTFNGEQFVKEQILSILNQLDDLDEVLISDDGSSDQTLEIISSIKDSRVKLFNSSFGNVVKNFEFIISRASGEIIFLCDQDDIWMPNKVSKHLEFYQNQRPKLVLSDFCLINEFNVEIDMVFRNTSFNQSLLKNIISNSAIGCTMSFNRSFKNMVLPLPKNIPMHDWWFFLIGLRFKCVVYIDEKLIKYRRHSMNYTKDLSKSIVRQFFWRLNIIYSLIMRSFYLKTRKNQKNK